MAHRGKLVSPSLLKKIKPAFTTTLKTQTPTETRGTSGGVKTTWNDQHTGIPAVISTAPSKMEIKAPDGTVVFASDIAILNQHFTDITEKHRVVDANGLIYDILLVDGDSAGLYTRLAMRIVR